MADAEQRLCEMIEECKAAGHTDVWQLTLKGLHATHALVVKRKLAERASVMDDTFTASRAKPSALQKRGEQMRKAHEKAESMERMQAKVAQKRREQARQEAQEASKWQPAR